MKVICITELFANPNNKNKNLPIPAVGDECTVLDEVEYQGMSLYRFIGYPADAGYITKAFAILPEADADEMAELEKEAILC